MRAWSWERQRAVRQRPRRVATGGDVRAAKGEARASQAAAKRARRASSLWRPRRMI
uniref:Uncharacterized protein n=1 Tax=Arundo donax TaxID=35708 RepID=A0A0A8YXJ7_ARUDO